MKRILITCLAVVAAPIAAWAQPGPAINGVVVNPRVFNDFSTTTLVATPSGPIVDVSINESDFADDGMGGSFANRHDVALSADAGATSAVFNIDDSFTVQAEVNLSVGSAAPRKEAGFRINSPITGDALFLVNSDAGEIVAFGGGAPFYSFGNSGGGNGYVLGTSLLMGFTMRGGGDGPGGDFTTIEYFIDRGAGMGIESSGPLSWANVERGPVDYSVAMYSQVTPDLSNAAEFANVSFNDITYTAIPEPSALALGALGLAGLACRRRR